ncbi:hypothetical protein DTL21_23325 [Bremerella cremea]|uniref:Zeta toxin domain-containing protein n=1 Tax=Blastopirellula marina TaxID=124 RepID=A0A2S8FEE3_9BACT|nr:MULTISPECIES: zeta toxin family protein [Pirellulaceae]PQO30294.1 hypothetical protein C5Y83_23290 [Blastopirellula marina]RCS43645.1 hypothetical protein DTL21_23325 [Bremerella cremea]
MSLRPLLQLGDPPHLVAIAGPNGAGKTTFYHSQVSHTGLRLVNADVLAKQLNLAPYAAAKVAIKIRDQLVVQRESFAFETVFSDPVGEKVQFLIDAAKAGYDVTLCFVGLASAKLSIQRVAMRVSQGGHDVPMDKLKARHPRTMNNLKLAIPKLERVIVFDQSDLRTPYRYLARFEKGKAVFLAKHTPTWLKRACP